MNAVEHKRAAAIGEVPRPKRYQSQARDEFQTGDLLLFRGHGFASWLIRTITRSFWSHAGLVFRFEGHVYCLEAVGAGVRLSRVSELMRVYHGGIDYFEVVPRRRSRTSSDSPRSASAFSSSESRTINPVYFVSF